MGGIGLLSGVLGDLLGLGLLLLYVCSVLPIGGCLRECNLYTVFGPVVVGMCSSMDFLWLIIRLSSGWLPMKDCCCLCHSLKLANL